MWITLCCLYSSNLRLYGYSDSNDIRLQRESGLPGWIRRNRLPRYVLYSYVPDISITWQVFWLSTDISHSFGSCRIPWVVIRVIMAKLMPLADQLIDTMWYYLVSFNHLAALSEWQFESFPGLVRNIVCISSEDQGPVENLRPQISLQGPISLTAFPSQVKFDGKFVSP